MTQHRKGESPSDVAARRVQKLRSQHGWSVARLAAECAKAGMPELNANVLTNLLSRRERRRAMTIDELAVLGQALGVSPAELWTPLQPAGALAARQREITKGLRLIQTTTGSLLEAQGSRFFLPPKEQEKGQGDG